MPFLLPSPKNVVLPPTEIPALALAPKSSSQAGAWPSGWYFHASLPLAMRSAITESA